MWKLKNRKGNARGGERGGGRLPKNRSRRKCFSPRHVGSFAAQPCAPSISISSLAKRSAERNVNARKERGNRLFPEASQGIGLEPLRSLLSRRHTRDQLVEAGEHDLVVPALA